jgi:hypothetical protein
MEGDRLVEQSLAAIRIGSKEKCSDPTFDGFAPYVAPPTILAD